MLGLEHLPAQGTNKNVRPIKVNIILLRLENIFIEFVLHKINSDKNNNIALTPCMNDILMANIKYVNMSLMKIASVSQNPMKTLMNQ